MLLKTENLVLKPLSENELNGNYVNWLNDKEVCKYNRHGNVFYTKEMALEYINSVKNNPTCEVYAVYYKDKHIGNISIQDIDKKNNNAEIAYLFGEKKYWGKGFATEASKALIKRAFNDLKLHRLFFGTHIENMGMQKVGEKLGFKKEGVEWDEELNCDIVKYTLDYIRFNDIREKLYQTI